jgi:hypothetical protein
MSKWTKFATSFYKNKKRTNKNYKFSQALTEAAAVYNGGNDKKGGNPHEVVKQNGGGKISEAMNIINGIDIDKLTSTVDVNDAIYKLNEIVIDTYTDTDADTGATKEQLIEAKKEKMDALEKKLKLLEADAPVGQEAVKPVEGQAVDAVGGKKAKKSAKKGKKSAKKGGKKARKSAKKGKR